MIKNLHIAFCMLLFLLQVDGNANDFDESMNQIILNIESQKSLGNFKEVFELNEKLIHLKDSIKEVNRAKLLAEMKEEFEFENKLKQFELLNAQNTVNEEKLQFRKQQQFAFIGSAFLLVLITLALRHRIIVIRKTKEIIQTKNEILQQERIRATNSEKFKNQFLANVSHEIRTPMNAIMGITNILIKNKHLPEQEKFLEAMHVSAKNLLTLINDILDLSKLEAGKVDIEKFSFNMSMIIRSIESQLTEKSKEKGIDLIVDIDPMIPEELLGDSNMLRNILYPILSNGIAFTDDGSVSLTCKVEGNTEKNYIISFIISDTGIGIVKEKLDRILNTFVKVYDKEIFEYDGSGLELPIIKQMIELQGGTIQVESMPGKGTTFLIEIPYATVEESILKEKTEEPANYAAPSDLSVLLVEDNEFNVMVASEEISSAFDNVKLEVAENGKLALEKVIANNYNLILMDVQMPIMNGYEATRQIRKLNGSKSKIPIIAMTANVMKQEIDKCFESGMNEYISKPFETSDLVNKINTLVSKKS